MICNQLGRVLTLAVACVLTGGLGRCAILQGQVAEDPVPQDWQQDEDRLLVTADERPPGFTVRVDGLVAPGRLFVLDAETGEQISLPTPPGADVMVYWSTRPNGRWRYASLKVQNRLDRQLRLEIGLRVQAGRSFTEFFDGERVWAADSPRAADRFTGRFPLTTLADAGACIALGYAPDQWLSYLRHGFTAHDDGGVNLETATRIVVDSGAQGRVDFLIGGFTSQWGHREALHWYYKSFPAFFKPNGAVDARAGLNGGSYLAWNTSPYPEMCRRLHVGWDWCYAPFRRTGDIYGRSRFWQYTPARKFSTDRAQTLEDYHQWRKKRFDNGKRCDVAMMCYIPSQIWCEEQLAREQYADALITDKRAKTYFDTPWVTGHDNELRVFPHKTSFGKQSLIDMAALAAENNIQGFAFDTANGGARYYGPHVNQCRGRAWDDVGVFVDEGIAIAELMDWCHRNQTRHGEPLAVVSNPGGAPCYLTPFRSDAAMIESDPTSVRHGSAQVLRRLLGHKTMVFWENYAIEELLDCENLTADEMMDALNGLADYTIIASLRMAAMPTPRICLGIRKLAQWMPLLAEIALAGWQPVPAATCDVGLTMSRAGEGLRQFVMTGNEGAEDAAGTIQVDNRWLAQGAMLFAARGARQTQNTLSNGCTSVSFTLPSREALVLRSALALSPAPEVVRARVTRSVDLDRTRIGVRLRAGRDIRCVLAVPQWGDMELTQIIADGRSMAFKECATGWRTLEPVALSGSSEITLLLQSDAFDLSWEQLIAFPWEQKGEPGFTLIANATDLPAQEAARPRIAAYFEHVKAQKIRPQQEPRVMRPEGDCAVRVQVVKDAERPQCIRLDETGRTLTVTGRTPDDLSRAVDKLLRALDRQYPFGGRLPGTVAFKACQVAGKEVQ